ncbi:DUF192 domain-containing protein [Moheibacter sediminis]|uniref:DUF192 domain-containing protein n=1 Tax=Moheibacter sediminis TaxID=1434700 RepID=A0A1W2C0Y7_9FLAO|nr:DUF192 domain-containing protein [Moheibacter sediminis]SMC78756.1 hypothetical protein SAMN06296427_10841 [Moheibacter sediminis]
MKKIFFALGIISLVISCEKKDAAVSDGANEVVEIPFKKEGELEFINAKGEAFKKIDIEIAETNNERARGLMDRSKMEENNGMIFIFGDDEIRPHTFYMKNTRIPLDIMYFSKDSVLINIARNAQPGADSEQGGGTVAGAASDSKFVVEINGGLADVWGIKEGETKIRWNTVN